MPGSARGQRGGGGGVKRRRKAHREQQQPQWLNESSGESEGSEGEGSSSSEDEQELILDADGRVASEGNALLDYSSRVWEHCLHLSRAPLAALQADVRGACPHTHQPRQCSPCPGLPLKGHVGFGCRGLHGGVVLDRRAAETALCVGAPGVGPLQFSHQSGRGELRRRAFRR